MNQSLVWVALLGLCLGSGLVGGFWWGQRSGVEAGLLSPILSQSKVMKDTHLQKYSIANLAQLTLPATKLHITELLSDDDKFTSWQFEFDTIGGQMSGLMNVPKVLDGSQPPKVIVLIRGYVPPEIYRPGVGTKAAGESLASAGYITLAPDFLSYGESDAEPSDVLEARFIKPAQIMNLIENIKQVGVPIPSGPDRLTDAVLTKSDQIGIWAHSNGGQIALTALEGLSQAIPTTLWAPVTAPFPYSVLFFSDEDADEGKAARASLAVFDKNYDAFDFSLTQHLDLLTGPLQLHQGTLDPAIPWVWNQEFRDKIKAENQARLAVTKTASPSAGLTASASATKTERQNLAPINLTYFEYAGADHNMKPGWDQAMARDLEFFRQNIP